MIFFFRTPKDWWAAATDERDAAQKELEKNNTRLQSSEGRIAGLEADNADLAAELAAARAESAVLKSQAEASREREAVLRKELDTLMRPTSSSVETQTPFPKAHNNYIAAAAAAAGSEALMEDDMSMAGTYCLLPCSLNCSPCSLN